MIIQVTGSRGWEDWVVVRAALLEYGPGLVREGGARGLDTMVGDLVRSWTDAEGDPQGRRWPEPETYPILNSDGWLGPGNRRNQRMIDQRPKADICLAFPMPGSSGTYDCAARAHVERIPVVWYPGRGLTQRAVDQLFDRALARLGWVR
jgi:hypothetical protein